MAARAVEASKLMYHVAMVSKTLGSFCSCTLHVHVYSHAHTHTHIIMRQSLQKRLPQKYMYRLCSCSLT